MFILSMLYNLMLFDRIFLDRQILLLYINMNLPGQLSPRMKNKIPNNYALLNKT